MGAQDQGADATAGRWVIIPRATCFVTSGNDVLLLKRGPHKRIFPNHYDGVGGHIERDEDALSAVVRETYEETGLRVQNVRLCGCSHIDAGKVTGIILFFFRAEALSRDFVDCDEGTLEWVPRDRILELDLVEDLPVLLPRILNMQPGDPPFFLHVSYDDADRMRLVFAGESR